MLVNKKWIVEGTETAAITSLKLGREYHVICMPFCESGKWRPVPLPEELSLDEEVFIIRFTCEVCSHVIVYSN